MIVQSRMIFGSVLMVSSVLHLAAMTMIQAEPPVRMEGGAPVAESSLGSSFADLAQGVQRPVKAVNEASDPVKPVTTASKRKIQTARRPVTAKTVSPSSTPNPVAPPESATTASAPSVTSTTRPSVPEAERKQAQTDVQPVSPDSITSALPDTVAPTRSLRPKQRSARRAPLKPASQAARPKGNADRNAKAGTQSGNSAKASQPRQASRKKSPNAQGNAAASNYPGRVMRRLSRVPRPRNTARGAAVIAFTIAANGNLASLAVSGTSGSPALDRAALAVVRKAQAFPPPPAGARRSFSIKIKGR